MTLQQRTVAIVEDDDLVRSATASLIRSLGLEAAQFPSAPECLAAYPDQFGCIISDINMPEMSGLEFQDALRTRGIAVPLILMTAYPTDDLLTRALNNGAHCFLQKPYSPDTLVDCLADIFGPLE